MNCPYSGFIAVLIYQTFTGPRFPPPFSEFLIAQNGDFFITQSGDNILAQT